MVDAPFVAAYLGLRMHKHFRHDSFRVSDALLRPAGSFVEEVVVTSQAYRSLAWPLRSLHTVVAVVAHLAVVENNFAVGACQEAEEIVLPGLASTRRGCLG